MKELIFLLKKTLDEKFPDLKYTFQNQASDKEIEELERIIEIRLPEYVRAFYQLCNGQEIGGTGLTEMGEILPISVIISKWKKWKLLLDSGKLRDIKSEPDKGIKNDWYNKKWIPFTYNGSSDHFCIDMDPDEEGNIGQIITMWHDEPERKLIASSFERWIIDYIDDLKSEKFYFDVELGNLQRR